MKKNLLLLAIAFFLGLAPHVFAQGFVPLAGIPGLTDSTSATSAINQQSLASFFNNLYKYCIGLAATLAVIEITWAGINLALNKDNISEMISSKGKIYNAIFGLILVLSPVLVFSIINPSILNLSLNLPPIMPIGTSAGGTAVSIPTTVDPKTGCSVTGKSYLLTATCSSPSGNPDAKSTASTWLSNNCNHLISDTSSPTCTADNSTGCTQATASCEGSSASSYTLINIGTGSSPNMEPLASGSGTQVSAAISSFISGCNGDGGSVCMNQTVSALFSDSSCPAFTTALPTNAQKACYTQALYCFTQADASIANGSPVSALSNFFSTSHNYTCQPTLTFTTQPLQ
jgi:hypothetical protein